MKKNLVFCVLLGLVAGCAKVPLSGVEAFGTATTSLSSSAQVAYQQIDDAEAVKVMSDYATDPSRLSKDPEWKIFNDAASGGVASSADLKARYALLGELGAYGQALGAIASADVAGDLDVAVSAYCEQVSTLNALTAKISGSTPVLDGNKISGTCTALSTIGGLILENRQRKLVIELVKTADPAVQSAASLLATELGSTSPAANFVVGRLGGAADNFKAYYAVNAGAMSLSDRQDLLGQVSGLIEAKAEAVDLFESASASAVAVGAAHAALAKAAEGGDISSADFLAALSKLNSTVSSLAEAVTALTAATESVED